ncbi:MAG TPA: DUF1573 domain-containing protein [Bacteroidales bacterium]|mgnify:CR=1 FL=1|nr:MAG: hypothetical protein BWY22_01307 [Bacteroidetes bacterium ADurb.Bin217]HPM12095.1 DUF1573 domain-containing protein [Bacteroidales bacterium]
MKKFYIILYCIGIIHLCAIGVSAQTISFKSLLFDYGLIYEHVDKIEALFEFTNTGDAPLILTKVKPGCGCTTADYTRDSVQPGAKGFIRIYFHPRGYSGYFTKTIQISSNSNVSQNLTLTIQGLVKKQNSDIENTYPYEMDFIRCKNPSINFNKVDFKTPVSDTVYVYNIQDTAVTLEFPHIPTGYRVEVYPQSMLLPNSHGIIIVYFDPQLIKKWGNFYDKIYIGFQGRHNHYRQKISVSGLIYEDMSKLTKKELKKAPKLVFDNTQYTFDTVMQNTIVTYSFSFTNKGKSPLYIRNIKTGCGCTAGDMAKKEYAKGERGTLQVTFNTQGKSQFVSQQIIVTSNDPSHQDQTIEIRGFVKPKPEETEEIKEKQ